MRSFVAVLVVLALVQLASAAKIQSAAFFSDNNCTVPVNVATTYGLTETSQWPGISTASVYDAEGAPCANVNLSGGNLGPVQSGTYTCLANVTAVGGMLVMEYTAPNCPSTSLSAIYEFYGPPNSTGSGVEQCTGGQIQLFNSTGGLNVTIPLFATIVCSNYTALAPTTSSSSSSTAAAAISSSSFSSSSSSAGNGAAESVSATVGLFAAVMLALFSAL